MRPPCEVIFKDMLPTIRAMLVKDLVERHNFNQVKVAKSLGITQPAVSQYLSLVRGTGQTKVLLKNRNFMRTLKKLSDAIAEGDPRKEHLADMYCRLCATLRKGRLAPLRARLMRFR